MRAAIDSGARVAHELNRDDLWLSKIRIVAPDKGNSSGSSPNPAIGTLAVLDIFYEALGAGMMGGLYATLTIILLVAIARILYALVLEKEPAAATAEGPATLPQKELASPNVFEFPLPGVTAEMLQPNTITDHTTRKLGSNH
ncbi:MAG: hypothetical protein QOE77_2899 [Blastocatellia bacterium]|nr:hypothetical protein [Blastocatellia bacterium]